MKKKLILISTTILIFWVMCLNAQNSILVPLCYNINVELEDSTLLVDLNVRISKVTASDKVSFLFNRYIQIEEALIDDSPLIISRSNDTLYFETSQKKEMTLFMKYRIPCSLTESTKVMASYSDSIYSYPILFEKSQIFCERFNKWYPVLYDNFSNYKVNIVVPKTHRVFACCTESNCSEIDDKRAYLYSCNDEDFPFFITPINIFSQHKVIDYNNTRFDFYFLPRSKRLVSVKDSKPVYISDIAQMDSLLNISVNRAIRATDWYNTNLWNKEIKSLSLVETEIFGLAACFGSFVLMDRMLMNMEALENYALSHELSHIWLGIHTEYYAIGKFFMGESIPEYVNLMFYRSWAGSDAFEQAIQDKRNLTLFDVPYYTVTFEQVLNQRRGNRQADEIIYHKGVAFVHEFQKMIGKDKLLKIISDTYSVPNHFVTFKDFEKFVKANGCWNEYLKLYEIVL